VNDPHIEHPFEGDGPYCTAMRVAVTRESPEGTRLEFSSQCGYPPVCHIEEAS